MIHGYYFITDSGLSRAGNLSDVEQALKANVSIVQYRNKTSDTREFYKEAITLRQICKNVTFLINDRVDIALACNADGVHLGHSDLPYQTARELLGANKIIGLTVHSLEDALSAQEMGVDYIGAAPIFATTTKVDAGTPLGIKGLEEICKKVELPVVAIGGIDLSNAHSVIKAGADSICAISAVLKKDYVCAEIQKFQALFT